MSDANNIARYWEEMAQEVARERDVRYEQLRKTEAERDAARRALAKAKRVIARSGVYGHTHHDEALCEVTCRTHDLVEAKQAIREFEKTHPKLPLR